MSTSSNQKDAVDSAGISRDTAIALLEAARKASGTIGFEAAIAVTDIGGHLKAFERGDGARFLTAEVAVDKAWTASAFGYGTHVWNEIITSTPEAAQLAHRPRLVAVGGGYPIVRNGVLIGGIGISGGTALQDQQACEAALKSLGFDVAA